MSFLEKERWLAKGKEETEDIPRQQCTQGSPDWLCEVSH